MNKKELITSFNDNEEEFIQEIMEQAKSGQQLFGYENFIPPFVAIEENGDLVNGLVQKDEDGGFQFAMLTIPKHPVIFVYVFDSFSTISKDKEAYDNIRSLNMPLSDIFAGKAGVEYARLVAETITVTALSEKKVIMGSLPYKWSLQDEFEYGELTYMSSNGENTEITPALTFDGLRSMFRG